MVSSGDCAGMIENARSTTLSDSFPSLMIDKLITICHFMGKIGLKMVFNISLDESLDLIL